MNNFMVKLCSVSNMCLAAKDFRIFVTDWFRRDMTCTRLSIVSRLFHQFVHAVRSRGERHHMHMIFEFCSLKTFISFFDDMLLSSNKSKIDLLLVHFVTTSYNHKRLCEFYVKFLDNFDFFWILH